MNYRERLEETMELREWSLRKLAHFSGVSKSGISTIFNDHSRDMNFLNVVALAKALDVSLDHIAGLPRREANPSTPDEEELLKAYRATSDSMREMILNVAKSTPQDRG